ncbi:MAG: radical SAM protein, partial [Thermodesulfobacteriota bacterium]
MARKTAAGAPAREVPSRGRFVNTGSGPTLQPIDIGHPEYFALIDPDTAFWSLVKRSGLAEVISGGELTDAYRGESRAFADEMDELRFGLKPSAVYFNPTEQCNLNCPYCYIPRKMRSDGHNMSEKKLLEALGLLKDYFRRTLPEGTLPQVIFHGAEPLLNREAVFAGIEEYGADFRFGIQTNATLLDDSAVEFLTDRGVSIGVSLDAATAAVADRTRMNWDGRGVFGKVIAAMERLRGYEGWSVICTITS